MEIKLQRLGGLLPITRESTIKVDWTEDELQNLIGRIRAEENENTKTRDGTSDYLEVNGESIRINIRNVPLKYKSTFEELKLALKPVKP